tara:strand:+ start:145 stop:570 length:426 start_codon:yes stop_codon:yes gene_type:complete
MAQKSWAGPRDPEEIEKDIEKVKQEIENLRKNNPNQDKISKVIDEKMNQLYKLQAEFEKSQERLEESLLGVDGRLKFLTHKTTYSEKAHNEFLQNFNKEDSAEGKPAVQNRYIKIIKKTVIALVIIVIFIVGAIFLSWNKY